MVSSRGSARAVALLAMLLAVLSLTAAPARAGGPAPATTGRVSVRTAAGLSAEARALSGRAVTVVCAATSLEWKRTLTAVGLPAASADEYYGFSLIPEGEMYLSPYVCEGLRLGAVSPLRPADELQVGWSVDVLLHESTHLGRFTYDEALAEGCARVGLPGELHRLYQVAYHSPAMSRLTLATALFRSTQDPRYHGGVCSPAS
jgi:hypothetical protein